MVTSRAVPKSSYVLAIPPVLGLIVCASALASGVLGSSPMFFAPHVAGTADVLMDAVLRADLATADAAIQHGADANAIATVTRADLARITGDRTTPLALAAARGDETMVAALIAAGASVRGPYGQLASCAARQRDDEDMQELLARYGVDTAPEDCSPEHMASRLAHEHRTGGVSISASGKPAF